MAALTEKDKQEGKELIDMLESLPEKKRSRQESILVRCMIGR